MQAFAPLITYSNLLSWLLVYPFSFKCGEVKTKKHSVIFLGPSLWVGQWVSHQGVTSLFNRKSCFCLKCNQVQWTIQFYGVTIFTNQILKS